MEYLYFSLLVITLITSDSVCECPAGSFGRKCKYTCHCNADSGCDETTGVCSDGCVVGWSGPTCQRENIAFERACRQKEGHASQNVSLATDADIDTCSISKAGVPGWWTLTLDGVKRVESFTLITDYLSDFYNWRVYVGIDNDIFGMTLCTSIRIHDNGATFRCQQSINGRYVTVVNRDGPVSICDFKIHECSPFTFGEMCTKTCNCLDVNERCETRDGTCTSGCISGFTGDDCHTECESGRYGQNCGTRCGHCKNGSSCDRLIGTCPDDCDPGWTGLLCMQPCELGRYGQSCVERCGHCVDGPSCDPINGICEKGCKPGWQGSACMKRCVSGSFGENCARECGKCLSKTSCDPVNGICKTGCLPGWEGLFCTQDCLPGFYGDGCQHSCRHCFHGLCHKETGQCQHGCAPGRIGVDCGKECAHDAFGGNCSYTCNRCSEGKGRLCDAVTGVCIYGCIPGYNGTNCSQGCPDGFFGVNCATKCGVCKAGTTCSKRTGHCPEGCALNFYGELCTQTDTFSDDSGSQLQVFLGATLGCVGTLMTIVTVCLVLVWKREHLPKIELADSKTNKEARVEEQTSCLNSTDENLEDVI